MLRLILFPAIILASPALSGCSRGGEAQNGSKELSVPGLNPTKEIYISKSGIRFIRIPAGIVTMGSGDVYGPKRLAKVSSFWISECEITYADIVGLQRGNNSKRLDFPVTGLQVKGVFDVVRKLSKCDGHVYGLPTDAQWERAARGDAAGAEFPWKGNDHQSSANVGSNSLKPVKQYPPNAFGLYDMIGNATELLADGYYRPIASDQIALDPSVHVNDGAYMGRGGSYLIAYAPLSYRTIILDDPELSHEDVGFRLAMADSEDLRRHARKERVH